MIHFTTLKFRNFISTGNYWTEIPLNQSQNTLVVGENGSGKSTMLDALCFGLYNKPFRDIAKPALVNSINQKDALIEVEFRTESHTFKVRRGIKPNLFEVFKDGVLLDQTATGDYQEYLEKYILKLSYKSFTQIVILGSASFTPFMQLSALDRRAIIEDLLDIQIFSVMNKLVKSKLTTITVERSANKLLIEGAQGRIAMQERYITEAQQDVALRIQEQENERAEHLQEIERLKMDIAAHTQVLQGLKLKVTDKSKVLGAMKKVTQLEAQIEQVRTKYQKTVKFFQSQDDCPTCTQKIDGVFKETQITQHLVKILECQEGLSKLETKFLEHQKVLNEIAEVEQEIIRIEQEIFRDQESITTLLRFNKTVDHKLEQLKESHQSTGREQLRLIEHQQELERLEGAKKELIESSAYYDAAGNLLKDTGIKTKIIRQYLPIINTLGNKFLASMDFFVNFNLDETFKETIKSRFRDEFTYHSFSEGEKSRIDMALMLTWRAVAKLKNSADTNLLILDEIFDSSLDNTGAEELMKILHNLEATNVFVISHRGDILQDKFRNVIRFQKQQNFSHIVI